MLQHLQTVHRPQPISDPETYDDAYVPKEMGLRNPGTICHINAVVQALISCPTVVRTTFERREYLRQTWTGQAFYDLVCVLAGDTGAPRPRPFGLVADAEDASAAFLAAFICDLRARRPGHTYGGRQESASEGLVLFLELLEPDGPPPEGQREEDVEENPISRLMYHRYDSRSFCGVCQSRLSKEVQPSLQINLFDYDLLPVKPTTPDEFRAMLSCHVSQHDGFWCQTCQAKTSGVRNYRLRMVAEVLICVFNNYSDGGNRFRYFPPHFGFSRRGGGELVYRQVAQIEHFGGLHGGHYVARGLRADGVFRFDDQAVRPSSLGPSPGVYMVFYHCSSVLRG